MPIKKKITPKTKAAPVKVEPKEFPVRLFIIISILIFVVAGIALVLWRLSLAPQTGDGTGWIYERHKFDQYRAANCGGDPMITVPECPRVR
jgi:hypothetical protein